jgi:hypothetical protein
LDIRIVVGLHVGIDRIHGYLDMATLEDLICNADSRGITFVHFEGCDIEDWGRKTGGQTAQPRSSVSAGPPATVRGGLKDTRPSAIWNNRSTIPINI